MLAQFTFSNGRVRISEYQKSKNNIRFITSIILSFFSLENFIKFLV